MNDYIIGVDEAGRGPLAGPVVAAAILTDGSIDLWPVKDSKLLSASKRLALYNQLITSYKYAVAIIEAPVIDKINILNATKKAMQLVISQLLEHGDYPIYIDGNVLPYKAENMYAIIKGDRLMKSISAASIIAKVVRDNIMLTLSHSHPQYAWHKNFGYGTKLHIEAIKQHGLTNQHRQSFLKKILN